MTTTEIDFNELADTFNELSKDLNVNKADLISVMDNPTNDSERKKVIKTARTIGAKLMKEVKDNKIPEGERKRRIAALEARIDDLELVLAFHPDLEERMKAEKELHRLRSMHGVWISQEIFHFEDLVDFEGDEIATLLREADKDVKSRMNLKRVLKGVEVFLRVSAFSAALAAKIAANAV